MASYRTHTCGQLGENDIDQTVTLAGWLHRKRNFGGLLFLDLRDHYGITQCVTLAGSPIMGEFDNIRVESVIRVQGKVVRREAGQANASLATGAIEVAISSVEVLSPAEVLPFPVGAPADPPEDARLRYRFLDLRRERLHANVVLRAKIIQSLRRRMTERGFLEFQTPILTASSPEGSRDFLVPSRLHPGKFYALPQAPQQFKQLLMVAGFDRYFQIAPCFRDEDARADRSPGEFYQLDVEMSFVDQEQVFAEIEPVLHGVFKEFSSWKVTDTPFPRITYADAMLKYGSDKPDLRNPLEIVDVSSVFADSDFKAFADAVRGGSVVRAVYAPGAASKPRSFFDGLTEHAKSLGAAGLAYVMRDAGGALKGPLAKFITEPMLEALHKIAGFEQGGAMFFVCDKKDKAAPLAGAIRTRLGTQLELIEQNTYRFCWVIDYPLYELDDNGAVAFSHNPFSMPQGGMEALLTQDPLSIRAYQYDIVCNGIELSSGAIRNHRPDVMVKAFELAGYSRSDVETRFAGLFNAFKYGAPPHGGLAPGVDRIVMLLANEANIREIIAFPLNQHGEDMLMDAPSAVNDKQLKDVHIKLDLPTKG
jgi:aspartyl-tRNA synthetase